MAWARRSGLRSRKSITAARRRTMPVAQTRWFQEDAALVHDLELDRDTSSTQDGSDSVLISADPAFHRHLAGRDGVDAVRTGQALTQFAIPADVGDEKVDICRLAIFVISEHDCGPAAEVAAAVAEESRVKGLQNFAHADVTRPAKQEDAPGRRFG